MEKNGNLRGKYVNDNGKFKKGNPGKPPGAKNKIPKTLSETFLKVFFDEFGEDGRGLKK